MARLMITVTMISRHHSYYSVYFKMAKRSWMNFKEKMKEKRLNKTPSQDKRQRKLQGSELTIQRLSPDVSGKAQKYSRVGPREFVPFDSQELTIENIKRSCEKYFSSRVGPNLICDVLAGEQGPSCKTVDQIPSLKVIHVRFINRLSVIEDTDDVTQYDSETSDNFDKASSSHEPPRKRHVVDKTKSECQSSKTTGWSEKKIDNSSPAKSMYPVSLSVTEMIKLGKFNKATSSSSTIVNIFKYDIESFTWSKLPTVVEFSEEKEPFAQGGFRKAFKATSKHPMYSGVWVIKRYLTNTIQEIEDLGQTAKEHTRKTVQMHMLARNFSLQLEQKVKEVNAESSFGEVPKYGKIYYGETEKGEFVTVEGFIDGKFVKYTNNNGALCVDESDILGQKAQCLSHFSYEKSTRKVMIFRCPR